MPSTVLIAAPDHLDALKQHDGLTAAQAFVEADALKALQVITRQRPDVVALERLFAGTSRGAALINRIKADPALRGCEIRIVSPEPTAPSSDASEREQTATAVAVAAPPIPDAPLDLSGTRRAPRYRITGGVEVLIDGNPAALIDLSLVGAMVVSPTILKPNQRVRVTLPDAPRPIRLSAGVAWAAFEMPKEGPRYRAGIEFFDPDPDAVGRFCERHRA